MKNIILPVVGIAAVLSCSYKASADTILYNNGPINGSQTAWEIDGVDNLIADSFTLSTYGNVQSVTFGGWTRPGDSISQLDWMITPDPGFGFPYASGTASLTETPSVPALSTEPGVGSYKLAYYSFSTGTVLLPNGVYWLDLGNAVTDIGGPAYWDQNSGHAQAVENDTKYIPSESFSISGAIVPEPTGMIPFSVAATSIAFLMYRKRRTLTQQTAAIKI